MFLLLARVISLALVLQHPIENTSIKSHNPIIIDDMAITSYCLSLIQLELFLKFVFFFCVVKLCYCTVYTESFDFSFL